MPSTNDNPRRVYIPPIYRRTRYRRSRKHRHVPRARWAEPAKINAIDFIVESAKKKVVKIEKRSSTRRWRRTSTRWRWRRRRQPHLLFHDEPTNHLDFGAVVWLEADLSTYNHVLVVTSHSQDSVCTNIMELTPKKKKVYYTGNHTTSVRTKNENEVS
ncbi:hypothetical protein BD410DRAFT_834379 [Rickenella mellea]|uniref:ABC transporter domain-containing protein n=1 Tax=Rickenella mellea TaxID=50990 RepID=A0A4R5XI87_9AGAM|nr:hypothetical protein BD410DRAFT_834379 [Rickenella mellea]